MSPMKSVYLKTILRFLKDFCRENSIILNKLTGLQAQLRAHHPLAKLQGDTCRNSDDIYRLHKLHRYSLARIYLPVASRVRMYRIAIHYNNVYPQGDNLLPNSWKQYFFPTLQSRVPQRTILFPGINTVIIYIVPLFICHYKFSNLYPVFPPVYG